MKHLNCGCSSINSNHQRSSTFSNSHSCVNQLKARGFKLCQEVSDMDARISAPSNNFSHTNTAKFTSQDIFSTVSNSEQTGSDNAPKIIIENNSFEDLPPNEDTQKYSSFIQKLMTNAKIMLGTRCSALHPSTCSEQPTKETDNCQYDSKATIHSNYKLGYVRDYTRYTPSDYCLCDEDDHENVSKLESTWTTADSLPKEQSLANSARSKPTSSINYSMQCQASTSDRLTVDSMPPTTNLKYFYSDNEYNSPHDDIFPKFKEPVYKKGQRKYLKGHKVYINSDDHHYEGPKVFADRPNVFIEEQNLYYDDQSTDINDKTGRDSIETCEKYIDSQYLNEYNHKTTRDVNKGDTPDKDTNDVSKKSESSRRMFSLLDTTWLNPFRREASKKSTLTQNLTNIEDEKKTDSLNNIPCRDVTCFRVTESNRANSAEPIRIRGDNHYTPEHISRGSLGVGSNSNEIKKVKAHSCDLYNDRNHKINSKYVYTHAQSQNIGKTSNQNKSDYNIRNNLVSTGCNVDPLVDKSIKTSLSNCDPNCRVCRHDKVHPNKDPRNKTSFVDTSVGSAAIRTTDMVASERGYERGDESNISTETSPPRFVEESPNSSKHKLLANSNKNDTNKSDSLQETPSNSLSNPMSFTTVNQCNMSGSFVSVTNKKTKNINKNRMEKRKKSSWGNDYNPSPKRVRSNHKQKDQDNQCAFIGSPVLISDVFKENEGTPNNNYSPHEDVYLPNCPTCRPYLRTNSLLTGEPLRIGSPNSYGGDRFIDSNSSRFRNRPTTSYENRLTRSSIEKARYMEERLSNVQDHFPWSPVKVIIDPELERITSELKTENRILKSELLEMRLELKHALEKVEGPMRSKLEAEKFRCEQLQQELHRASHDMELSKDAFIKESHKLKTQLFEATTNMTQLEAINQRLRNEMEVLDGLCAKLEEDLVNQKVNEAETLKRITQRKLTSKKDVYSEEEISAEQLEATYDYLKDTDCIVSELVSENTIHESNLNVLARKLSKTIKDSDPRENCLNIPTELTDAVKMIKDLTDMVEKRKGERISVNTFSVSKNNCSCQSPPSVAVAACQYIGLNDIGIVVSKSLFPSVPPNVNNEKIAISTKTLFGVPQNFVVENISSKNIVENTELPLKPAASFVHQDFPFAGDSPCLKDQCTDPKSADKKISYNPPIYPLAKPLMVDKESNYETRKCAFGDYIKDPKDNVVACYVVNTPICPLKPPTQDKGSPPTMKDQSTFCCNDKNDDNYKCADLEEPPCKGLGIPCDEVEANEDVNNKCEDSEEAPCKSLGIPCCNVKADEEDVTLDTKQDLPLGEKIDFDYSDPDPNYPVNPDIIVDFKTCADTESAPCKDKGIPCVKKGENIPSLTDNAPVTSSAVTKNLTANSQSPCARFGYPCSKNKNDTSGQLPEDINIIQEDNKTDAATEDTVITIDKDIGSGIICPVTAAFEDIGEQKKIAVPCGEDAACASIDRPCTKLADKIETESFAVKTDTAKGGDTEIAKSMDQQEEPGEEQVKGGFLSLKVEVTKDATSEVEKYNFEFEKPKTALITTVIQDGILGVKTEGPTGTIKSTLKYLPGGIVEVQTEITEATGTPDVARPFLPTTKREDSVPKQETVTMPKSSLIKGESDVEICDDITCQNKAITTGPEFEEVVICPKSGKPCKNRITKRPCTSEDQFKPAGTQEPQLREAGVVTDPKAKRQQEVETVPQTTTTSASKQVPIFDKTTSHTTPTKDAVIKTLEIETKETPTSLEDVTVSSPQQTHEIPVSGKSVGDDDTRATIASSTLPIEMTSKERRYEL
ncbi:uncharacterized protein [Diabrotica undecimpunctata]|uniref:uncharacterized protein n=1 Tax=Diabrotica undecimpunctata TaxID=50387 RepID=UPI003B641A6B